MTSVSFDTGKPTRAISMHCNAFGINYLMTLQYLTLLVINRDAMIATPFLTVGHTVVLISITVRRRDVNVTI